MNFICKYQTFSELDQKKLRYGLEGIYLTITKLIVLFLLAVILDMLPEFILVTVLFNIIRYTGFGFHAEKSYQCLYIICGVSLLHYLLFAPADTKKRPLSNKRKRFIRKVITIIIGSIYTLAIILLDSNYWTAIILSAMILEVISISPITYRIFNQPYNNYKTLNV